MERELRNKIAWRLLKDRHRKNKIRFTNDLRRDLCNLAKRVGIAEQRIFSFYEAIICELFLEVFGEKIDSCLKGVIQLHGVNYQLKFQRNNEQMYGETAYKLLKNEIAREGLILDVDAIKREIGNIAQQIGVSKDDLWHFIKNISLELLPTIYDILSPIEKN